MWISCVIEHTCKHAKIDSFVTITTYSVLIQMVRIRMYTVYNNLDNLRVLVQEDLKDVEQTTTQQQQQQDYRSSPLTPEEVQWSYTDPQGKVQGKSASSRNNLNNILSFMFLSRSPLEFPIRLLILGWVDIFWNGAMDRH